MQNLLRHGDLRGYLSNERFSVTRSFMLGYTELLILFFSDDRYSEKNLALGVKTLYVGNHINLSRFFTIFKKRSVEELS